MTGFPWGPHIHAYTHTHTYAYTYAYMLHMNIHVSACVYIHEYGNVAVYVYENTFVYTHCITVINLLYESVSIIFILGHLSTPVHGCFGNFFPRHLHQMHAGLTSLRRLPPNPPPQPSWSSSRTNSPWATCRFSCSRSCASPPARALPQPHRPPAEPFRAPPPPTKT